MFIRLRDLSSKFSSCKKRWRLRTKSALLAPGGEELQRPWRALDCGYLVFPHRLWQQVSCWRKVLTQSGIFLSLLDVVNELFGTTFPACAYHPSLSASCKLIRFKLNRIAYLLFFNKEGELVTWNKFRNELERALHAGSVMEKTVLESSQIKSHQPHFGSLVGIRDGKLSFDFSGSRSLHECCSV